MVTVVLIIIVLQMLMLVVAISKYVFLLTFSSVLGLS